MSLRAAARLDRGFDERNLISLCAAEQGNPRENRHLLVVPLGDVKYWSIDAEDAALHFYGRGQTAPMARRSGTR